MAGGTKKGPIRFLKEVGQEMKRVTWPTRKELTKYTIVTALTVIFFVIYFAVIDLGLSELVRIFLE